MSTKQLAEDIFYAALDAVKSETIVQDNIALDANFLYVADQKISLDSFKDLYVFSVGKAGYTMAKTAQSILNKNIKGGLAVSLSNQNLDFIEHCRSTHPIVSQKSLQCADKLINIMQTMDENDLFLFFLSGGASAMIEKPIEGITLEDFQKISKALLGSGIDIKTLNRVRKSISLIKGGKLTQHCAAKGYVLVLSDVIGDELSSIGSAPMYDVSKNLFPHFIIGSNTIALKGAQTYIRKHFKDLKKVEILTSSLAMPSTEASAYVANTVKEYSRLYDSYALLIGGETLTQVQGSGQGGRNSELALRLLLQNDMSDFFDDNSVILCAGSDGVDGNSPANGAFIDRKLYEKMKTSGLDPQIYLDNSDSYGFFHALGYDFTTGITGTNVMDFVIILKNKRVTTTQLV
jgi:glycerate-2-kinase